MTYRTRYPARADQLIETFVAGELARQISHSYSDVALYHYRTRDGLEVDFVLERSDGCVVGIEVKAGATVRAQDARGLKHLRDLVGRRFIAGFILHTGADQLPFGDRIVAMPISGLWTTPLP